MRKLASIQKVHNIRPIEGADAIEALSIQGWHLVSKKGEFKEGDWCVFFEIDSILPDLKSKIELEGREPKEEDLIFEFMRPRKFRVKTIKLKGQIAMGLALPIHSFPQLDNIKLEEDLDLTELLEVKKYDPEQETIIHGEQTKFKEGIRKTDETRVQNLKKNLTKYKGLECYISEKLEGTSTTYYLVDDEFGVCTRNNDIVKDLDQLDARWKIAIDNNIEEKMRDYSEKFNIGDFAIQGELIGPKVQGNIYNLDKREVRIFSFFKVREQRYSTYDELVHFISQTALPLAPIIDNNFALINDIDKLVELSIGESKLSNRNREGIVIRTKDYTDNGEIFSCKAINPYYSLSEK